MALDNFRTIALIWDKANKSIIKTIKTASSDTAGRYLSVKVLDEGQEVDLTGAKLQLYWEHPNFNTSGTDDFNTVNNGGLFKMTFSKEMLTNIGKLTAHLVLTLPDGKITSDGFTIEVIKGANGGVVVPTNGKGLVEQIAKKINKGEVTLNDLTQEVKEALTGGAVAVVGETSVGTENLKEEAVTPEKTSFLKGVNLFNGVFTKRVSNADTITPENENYRSAVVSAKFADYHIEIEGQHNALRIFGTNDLSTGSMTHTYYTETHSDNSEYYVRNTEGFKYLWVAVSISGQEPKVNISEGKTLKIGNHDIETLTPNNVSENLTKSAIMFGAKKYVDILWSHGGLHQGQYGFLKNRLYSFNFIEPKEDIKIEVLNAGYRYSIVNFNLDGTFISDSGWSTYDRTIEYDPSVKYKIVLARVTEDVNEYLNVDSFIKNYRITEGSFSFNDSDRTMGGKDIFGLIGKKYVGVGGIMGASPINSIEAIRQSKLAGAWGVELDLRLTKDNDIVLCHDELLEGVVNAPSGTYVYEKTVAEIKQYTYNDSTNYADYGVQIPTLKEALAVCKELGLVPFLDIKDSSSYEYEHRYMFYDLIIKQVSDLNLSDSTVFISTKLEMLKYVRNQLPYAWCSAKRYIQNTTVEDDIAFAESVGGNVLMQIEPVGSTYPDGVLTNERIRRYHEKGYPVKDIDFVFTFLAENQYKELTKFTYPIQTTDGGATWVNSTEKAHIEVINSAESELGVDCLHVYPNDISWNNIARLRPMITVDSILKANTQVNCVYYNKKIIITFKENGSVVSPTDVNFSVPFFLRIVF